MSPPRAGSTSEQLATGTVSAVALPQPLMKEDVLNKPPAFRALHPNVSVNFQLNRWLNWMTPCAVQDVAAVAAHANDYPALAREFLALGDRLLLQDRVLDAAFSYRAAEFFLVTGDERKVPTRRRFVELLRGIYGIRPEHRAAVPYEKGSLPVYRFGTPTKGTVVMFGGFDSYTEEFFPLMLAIARPGYQVVAFEGPGQGGALEEYGLVLTPEWQRPVGAVLDHFGLDDVTVLGISLGGGLAIRAAAQEPRVTRVISDDVLTDFLACNLRQFPVWPRRVVRMLLRLRAHPLLDILVKRRMRSDLLAEWGVAQGEHTLGVTTPHQYLEELARYTTRDVSKNVLADVLLLAGAEDHYVPFTQLTEQINTLTNARSVSARVFTRAEHAQNHVQTGNIALSVSVMLGWLAGLDERDAKLGDTGSPAATPSLQPQG